MSELTCLELSVLLWLAHLLMQLAFAGSAFNLAYLAGARDEGLQPEGIYHPRATRALANYVENYGPFIAADVALILAQRTGGYGAALWIVARMIYLPLYMLGVPYLRTVGWLASIVGLLMMTARLFGW